MTMQTPSEKNQTANNAGDVLSLTLIMRQDLRLQSRNDGSKSCVVIEDPVRSKFYQLGLREYQLAAALDGDRTVGEVIEDLNRQLPANQRFDETSAATICHWMISANLVEGAQLDTSKRLNQQATALRRSRWLGAFNPISCKFKLLNPNNLLTAILPYTRWLFSGWFFALWCVAGIYAVAQVFQNWDRLNAATVGILSGHAWFWLALTWLALKIVHETAHGIACRKYGGEVPELGVLFLLFTPMAYVNVTSMWRFANPWHRIVVSAAGMYVELFLSFVAIIVWSQTSGVVADLALDVFMMASITTLLFNANPLMRFDGYFILSDLAGIANLYPKGVGWFGNHLENLVLGTQRSDRICPPHEQKAVAIYGTLAFAWKLSVSLSLLIASSVLFHGAGLVLCVLGIVAWFGIPIWKRLQYVFAKHSPAQPRPARIVGSASVAVVLSVLVFSIFRAPALTSAPAIVQFADQTPLRAGASGFVERILVNDGQAVKRDQPLLVLANPELANEVLELERLANEAKIQARIHKQEREFSLMLSQQRKYEEHQRQLSEKRAEAKSLQIVAPFDGFVFQRNLDHKIGSYAERGDVLLTVAQRQSKEIIVSVDQQDLDSIKSQQGEPLRVVFPGLPIMTTTLTRVDPRASAAPSHLSLCAHVGGPLAVKPVSKTQDETPKMQLISPRFTAVLELDSQSSRHLHTGQRGRAFFASREESLGNYLYRSACQWLESKLEIATQTAPF